MPAGLKPFCTGENGADMAAAANIKTENESRDTQTSSGLRFMVLLLTVRPFDSLTSTGVEAAQGKTTGRKNALRLEDDVCGYLPVTRPQQEQPLSQSQWIAIDGDQKATGDPIPSWLDAKIVLSGYKIFHTNVWIV